jgi:hypothetical protein
MSGRIFQPDRFGGEGGIRTLGSLLDYGALAKRCFRPLSHLTKMICASGMLRIDKAGCLPGQYTKHIQRNESDLPLFCIESEAG